MICPSLWAQYRFFSLSKSSVPLARLAQGRAPSRGPKRLHATPGSPFPGYSPPSTVCASLGDSKVSPRIWEHKSKCLQGWGRGWHFPDKTTPRFEAPAVTQSWGRGASRAALEEALYKRAPSFAFIPCPHRNLCPFSLKQKEKLKNTHKGANKWRKPRTNQNPASENSILCLAADRGSCSFCFHQQPQAKWAGPLKGSL